MAKRVTSSSTSKPAAKKAASSVASVTPVRKTVAPRKTTVQPVQAALTHDQIAVRAFLISCSGTGGSETENWLRAESELKSEQGI